MGLPYMCARSISDVWMPVIHELNNPHQKNKILIIRVFFNSSLTELFDCCSEKMTTVVSIDLLSLNPVKTACSEAWRLQSLALF